MTNSIEKIVDLKAPVERVWRAITDHVEFGQWFKVRVDAPFAVGEISRGQMTYPGYEHYPWEARVVAMEEPRLFSYEWPHITEPDADTTEAPWTLVEFRLEPIAEGTRLTMTESGFDAVPEELRAEAMRSNEGGWQEQTGNIRAHVES